MGYIKVFATDQYQKTSMIATYLSQLGASSISLLIDENGNIANIYATFPQINRSVIIKAPGISEKEKDSYRITSDIWEYIEKGVYNMAKLYKYSLLTLEQALRPWLTSDFKEDKECF